MSSTVRISDMSVATVPPVGPQRLAPRRASKVHRDHEQTAMRFLVLREIPEDERLCCQWNELAQQVERPEVFYTYEWALAVQRSYEASMTPLVFLAYEGDTLAGLAALATDKAQSRAFFLAGSTADYCEFVSHPDDRSWFVDAILAEISKLGIRELVLANLPADSASFGVLRSAAGKYGYHLLARRAYLCPQVSFDSPDQRERTSAELLRKKKLRRGLKALMRSGPLAVETLTSWEQIEGELPQFVRAHVARFLATGRISNLISPERRAFLEQLARELARSGWLALTRLRVAEKAVAWNFGFRYGGSWFWYLPTIATEVEECSPGSCLLSQIVIEACNRAEIRRVDLGLGDEGYKDRLANGVCETLHVTLHASLGRHAWESVRYTVASAVKTMPSAEVAIRTALRVSRLRERLRQAGPRGFIAWTCARAWLRLFGKEEIAFYEWPGQAAGSVQRGATLRNLDFETLALAATEYAADRETTDYLLRAARRLRANEARGSCLVDNSGIPVHFCWATPFEGFRMAELGTMLTAPAPEADLIFDCWTPRRERGRGHYGKAAGLLAAQLQSEGRQAWIFSAVRNGSSARGIEKSGFQPRYRMVRHRIAGWPTLSRQLLQDTRNIPLEAAVGA